MNKSFPKEFWLYDDTWSETNPNVEDQIHLVLIEDGNNSETLGKWWFEGCGDWKNEETRPYKGATPEDKERYRSNYYEGTRIGWGT